MSAVKRSVFNILAALSLVLCVATAAVWVRSSSGADIIRYLNAQTGRGFAVMVSDGDVAFFAIAERGVPPASGFDWHRLSQPFDLRTQELDATTRHHRFGSFGVAWSAIPNGSLWVLLLPLWSLSLALAALPAAATYRTVAAHRRRSTGRCATCGYDLRATPGRCPECGTAVTPAA
jgi:hypothetical protein